MRTYGYWEGGKGGRLGTQKLFSVHKHPLLGWTQEHGDNQNYSYPERAAAAAFTNCSGAVQGRWDVMLREDFNGFCPGTAWHFSFWHLQKAEPGTAQFLPLVLSPPPALCWCSAHLAASSWGFHQCPRPQDPSSPQPQSLTLSLLPTTSGPLQPQPPSFSLSLQPSVSGPLQPTDSYPQPPALSLSILLSASCPQPRTCLSLSLSFSLSLPSNRTHSRSRSAATYFDYLSSGSNSRGSTWAQLSHPHMHLCSWWYLFTFLQAVMRR